MTLSELMTEINRMIASNRGNPSSAFHIYELLGGLAHEIQRIDEKTTGGLPEDETVLVLKAKIETLNDLLNFNNGILQKIKNIIGAADSTAATLPDKIKVMADKLAVLEGK